ncbi:DUF5991 domain-containing protein [Burkholderia sp. F1]|uniref:DUF5991 domain-containing protein n=1 Tax=Burkholderia sp. F1 TaxID=3366817 RepID=UPI003D7104AC
MKYVHGLLFLIFAAASSPCFSEGVGEVWEGDYEYSNSFWDGVQSVITDINLKISSNGGCSVSWEGFQKDEKIICSVGKDSVGGGVIIRFVSYSNGDSKNEYGVEVYKPKARLFSLVRLNKNPIITTWGEAYRPPKTKRSGVYFKKID